MPVSSSLARLCILVCLLTARTFADDRSTNDALRAIDAVSPTTAPAIAPHETTPDRFYLRLAWQFAPALAAAVALAIAASVAGTFVLLRREALVALAIPQAVAVGAAVGMRYGWPTLPPALIAAAAALIYLVWSRRSGDRPWALPAMYVAGLSISFLLIANKGQDVADLQKLFTGVDVAVSPALAYAVVPLLLLAGGAVAVLWRRWLLIAQAPAAAELAGLHPARYDALFLGLLTLILLLGTNALGVVMVLALLFLPAAAALAWSRSIPAAFTTATIIAVGLVFAGFVVANEMSWPFSQTVGGLGFAVMMLLQYAARLGASG